MTMLLERLRIGRALWRFGVNRRHRRALARCRWVRADALWRNQQERGAARNWYAAMAREGAL